MNNDHTAALSKDRWAQEWREHCEQMRQYLWARGETDPHFGKYNIKENDWVGFYDTSQEPGEVKKIYPEPD